MIHSKARKNIREVNQSIFSKPIFITIYILTAFILIFLTVSSGVREANNMKLTFSVADSYIKLTTFMYLMPTVIIFQSVYFVMIFIDDLRTIDIVRHNSRTEIWVKQVRKIFITSLYFTIFIIASTFVISIFFSDSLINFDKTNSLFYYYTEAFSGATVSNPYGITFGQIFIFSFISVYLAILIISMIVFLIKWMTNNVFIGWIIVIVIVTADIQHGFSTFRNNIQILVGNLNNFYPCFLNISNMVTRLINPIIWCVAIYIIGYTLTQRKDFY